MNESPTLRSPASLPSKTALPPLWGRIDSLWLLMVPFCALVFALCLPLAPNDLWYHVRAGQIIWQNGAIPTQNLMSQGIPLSYPYYYQSWLAELALYITLRFAGLSGLALLRAGCLCATFVLIVAATFRQLLRLPAPPSRLTAARWAALCAFIGFAIASSNVDLRPQSFSTLFFGVWTFAVLELRAATGSKAARWGIALVVLNLLWANTHGGFVVSLLGLAALAIADLITRSPRTRTSVWVAVASLTAVICNPRGWHLFTYVSQMSHDEISQRYIEEWKSPGLDDWHSVLFWLTALAIFIVAFAAQRRAPSARESLGEEMALALFFVMATRDQRSMIWFALWAAPLLARLIARRSTTSLAELPTPPRAAQFVNAVLLLFLLALPLMLLPNAKATLPWPADFQRRFAPNDATLFPGAPPLLLEKTTPVAAAHFLRQHPPRALLFTDMVCGSYLTYATQPSVKPWCDPRIEMFPAAFWEDYLRLSNGPASASAELITRGFSDALLDRDSQSGLVKRLQHSSDWHIVAKSGTTLLFRRNSF